MKPGITNLGCVWTRFHREHSATEPFIQSSTDIPEVVKSHTNNISAPDFTTCSRIASKLGLDFQSRYMDNGMKGCFKVRDFIGGSNDDYHEYVVYNTNENAQLNPMNSAYSDNFAICFPHDG